MYGHKVFQIILYFQQAVKELSIQQTSESQTGTVVPNII